uniref:Uncharacterized protein n=1 Tax=Aegilops tauschii subsp. strangulata TaxID=200361 RepID=A0A452ZX96_AEGTS
MCGAKGFGDLRRHTRELILSRIKVLLSPEHSKNIGISYLPHTGHETWNSEVCRGISCVIGSRHQVTQPGS